MKKIYKIIIFLFFIMFLCFFNYKKIFSGNTISIKNKDKNIENILNGKFEYKADTQITIYSNKTKNIYSIMQEETNEKSYQEVINGCDIEGIRIFYTDNVLKVENSS